MDGGLSAEGDLFSGWGIHWGSGPTRRNAVPYTHLTLPTICTV